MDRPQIDLFASEENRQLEVYCSRHQECLVYGTGSLKMSWENVFGYAFPTLALIHVVLDKLEQSRNMIILIALKWPRKSWYPRLLKMSIQDPILLPWKHDLLTQNRGRLHHPQPDLFHLVAWKLSGNDSLMRNFRRTSKQCRPQSENNLQKFEKSWEKVVYWCSTRVTDPIRAPLIEILAFLQSLMNSGFAYRTIGVYRSAISKFHVGIEGVPTGQHARVSKFMKGLFHRNPHVRHYFQNGIYTMF